MIRKYVAMTLLGTLFGVACYATSALGWSQENRSVKNVEKAFTNLAHQGEWLGYHVPPIETDSDGQFELFPYYELKGHVQGMARSPYTDEEAGIGPIFYLTVSNKHQWHESAAGIMVVALNSLPTDGERVGSNRLQKDKDTMFTYPPWEDEVVNFIETPQSSHPSGIAMVGDILAVPMSGYIYFYDCRNPYYPREMDYKLRTGCDEFHIFNIPDVAETGALFQGLPKETNDPEKVSVPEPLKNAFASAGHPLADTAYVVFSTDEEDEKKWYIYDVKTKYTVTASREDDTTWMLTIWDFRGKLPDAYDLFTLPDIDETEEIFQGLVNVQVSDQLADRFSDAGHPFTHSILVEAAAGSDADQKEWHIEHLNHKYTVSASRVAGTSWTLTASFSGMLELFTLAEVNYMEEAFVGLQNGEIPAQIADEFASAGHPLTEAALLHSIIDNGGEKEWHIYHLNQKYDIKAECTGFNYDENVYETWALSVTEIDYEDEPYPWNHGGQAIAITKLPPTAEYPSGRFLLMTNGGPDGAHFHWSNGGNFFASDFEFPKDADHFKYMSMKTELKAVSDSNLWPVKTESWEWFEPEKGENQRAFQNMNFINQSDGKLFLIASCNSHAESPRQNWLGQDFPGKDELFLHEVIDFHSPSTIQIRGIEYNVKRTYSPGVTNHGLEKPSYSYRLFERCKWHEWLWWECSDFSYVTMTNYDALLIPPNLQFSKRCQANFNAGACAYITPSGELLYYGASHFADGNVPRDALYDQTHRIEKYLSGDFGKLAEYSNKNVMTDESPTAENEATPGCCGPIIRENHLGGPYEIPETHPGLRLNNGFQVVAPWVRMFENDNFKGIEVMMDWKNQDKESYEKFSELDGEYGECQDVDFSTAENQQRYNGFNNCLSSFLWCGPIGSTLRLYEDDKGGGTGMFISGSGKVVGKSIGEGNPDHDPDWVNMNNEFSSAYIDWDPNAITYKWSTTGNGRFSPDDTSSEVAYIPGGGSATDIVTFDVFVNNQKIETVATEVTVTNVAPRIGFVRFSQGSGTGLEVTLSGEWYDRSERCTVYVDWGDGSPVEAFGDQAKVFDCVHEYTTGMVYTVTVYVSDGESVSPVITKTLSVQKCDYGETKLRAHDISAQDYYGGSVAVDGDRIVVGASRDDGKVENTGAVYIHDWIENEWVSTKIMAEDGQTNDYFGTSVSVSGNRLVVGARGDNDRGLAAGSAYVFDLIGSEWVQTAKLLVPDDGEPHIHDWFGTSVSAANDSLVIGAPSHKYTNTDPITDNPGAAYIYEYTDGAWHLIETLSATTPAPGDKFGQAVSLSDDRLVVGAPNHMNGFDDDGNPLPFDPGIVYVYELNGDVWEETQAFTAPTDADDIPALFFGKSLSLDGDRFVVGGSDGGGEVRPSTVSIYVYEWNGTDWSETVLSPDGTTEDDFSGGPVAISGDKIVGGTPYLGETYGSFYFYEWNGTDWVVTRAINAADSEKFDQFGYSVAVSGDRFVVGCPLKNDFGVESGAVYVFDSVVCYSREITPEAVCQNATLAVGETGTSVLDPADIDGGSTHPDNAPISLSVSKYDFICEDIGEYPVILTATDDLSGASETCLATVTVVDETPPTITAPADVTVNADPGACSAVNVELGVPFTSDNCAVVSIAHDAPAVFPAGITPVTWVATDASGNSASTVHAVTVVDNEAPVLTIPDDVTVMAQGIQSVVDIGEATAVDNCSVSISNDAPASFPVGTTTVIWTAMDTCSNTVSDTQQVTVLGGKSLKTGVIGALTPFSNESKNIKKAIAKIENSLKEGLWLDEVHLDEQHGLRVFNNEYQALVYLTGIVAAQDDNKGKGKGKGKGKRNTNTNISDAAMAAIQSAIHNLVEADQIITMVLYDEVSILPASKPSVEKHIELALEDIHMAETHTAGGDQGKAIQCYKKAWKHTVQAKKIINNLN